jgi:hypothetical protein
MQGHGEEYDHAIAYDGNRLLRTRYEWFKSRRELAEAYYDTLTS